MNDEQYAEVLGALRANEKEHESYNRRLHEHDDDIRKLRETQIQIERLTNAVNNLAAGIGEVKTAVQGVDRRVADLEREPGEKWKKVTWKVAELLLAAIVGGVIAYLIK
jgi:predicted RNase H-like nuclease (RuvC/YqgF family)